MLECFSPSCNLFSLPSAEAQFIPNKQLQPKETQIYIKLVKYAMQALDIYQVGPPFLVLLL